jgi:hypothetical protein
MFIQLYQSSRVGKEILFPQNWLTRLVRIGEELSDNGLLMYPNMLLFKPYWDEFLEMGHKPNRPADTS